MLSLRATVDTGCFFVCVFYDECSRGGSAGTVLRVDRAPMCFFQGASYTPRHAQADYHGRTRDFCGSRRKRRTLESNRPIARP
jgi:hypothetical protein